VRAVDWHIGIAENDTDVACDFLDVADINFLTNFNLIFDPSAADDANQFGVVVGHHREQFKHGHKRAEVAVRLGHFDADRAGADDDQVVG